MTASAKTLRAVVLKRWPKAFGWREFSTSDYTVESGTGKTIGSAFYAKDAWASAALKRKRTGRR